MRERQLPNELATTPGTVALSIFYEQDLKMRDQSGHHAPAAGLGATPARLQFVATP
jgi:hypothetical protein